MTPAPHVVVIALAANELSSPHTSAMLKSAKDVLGQSVTVSVDVIDESRRGGSPIRDKPTAAYALLTWDEHDSRTAHLRCYIPESNRWVHRDVTFEEQDPERERGRTLGFVIGSIFMEGREPQSEGAVRGPGVPQKSATVAPKRFQVAAAATFAAPGDVTSLGAWLGAQRQVSALLALGLAAEARIGTVTAASAGTRYYSAGGTATLRLFPRAGHAWLGTRTSFGGEYYTFTHRSEDDPSPVTQAAFIPRLDLLLHGTLELEGASVLFFDIGTNYRFGTTYVYVHEQQRARVPAFVGIGRIGIGARF